MTLIFALFLLLPSCNNEEVFIIEESAIVEEVPTEEETTEEETPNTEDEVPVVPVDVVDDNFITTENIPIEMVLHTNDTSLPTSGTIATTEPFNGALSINDNGTPDDQLDDLVIYTPNPSFSGIDSFEYTICDAQNIDNCDTAIVSITVEPKEVDIATELKSFPSAYGAGAYTTGGRGGQVIHVTNLNDSGAGSLRDALSKTFPRIIVFDVSGEINLQSRIILSNNYGDVTIAGQTAPRGGITITGARLYLIGNDNMIIRYIRFRNGSDSDNGDCMTLASSSNIIVDHCSFAWSKDEALDLDSSYNDGNITVQNCLFYENKTAMLLGGTPSSGFGDVSVLRNVSSNTSHRFPKTNGALDIDVINNLIHNWRYRTLRLDASVASESFTLNLIGNYFQSGTNTVGSAGNTGTGIHKISTGNGQSNPTIYSRFNHIDQDILNYYSLTGYNENTDESSAWSNFPSSATEPVESSWFVDSQLPLKGASPEILPNTSLKAELLPHVGASGYLEADGNTGFYRDELDLDAVDMVQNDSSRTYIQHAESQWNNNGTIVSNSRAAGYDTDNDGMPDIWERAMFGDLSKNASGDEDGDGYTNLEEFLNIL
ncbi:Ig-like domain-containing protein [Algibacter luteus]|uniref:Ig-like domain-containing protein n=1 Tax=Algibacter luteus TaxID=1178825 RepID=UPI00259A5854|nr:Ig-like domain-containing protein [Algibacter luteus]WJJ95479.1 Ig-like domain-containing protein [Algibacter luteus]